MLPYLNIQMCLFIKSSVHQIIPYCSCGVIVVLSNFCIILPQNTVIVFDPSTILRSLRTTFVRDLTHSIDMIFYFIKKQNIYSNIMSNAVLCVLQDVMH